HASAQGKPPSQPHIRKVRAAIALKSDQQPFVQSVQFLIDPAPFELISCLQGPLKSDWHITETENRKFNRRQHLKIFARLDQTFHISGTSEILFNCPA